MIRSKSFPNGLVLTVTAQVVNGTFRVKGYYQTELGRVTDMPVDDDEIVRHFPDLKPLVDVNGCRLNGAPIFAEELAWYWYKTVPSPENLSAHLRMDASILPDNLTREQLNAFVRGQRPRWQHEANVALGMLGRVAA